MHNLNRIHSAGRPDRSRHSLIYSFCFPILCCKVNIVPLKQLVKYCIQPYKTSWIYESTCIAFQFTVIKCMIMKNTINLLHVCVPVKYKLVQTLSKLCSTQFQTSRSQRKLFSRYFHRKALDTARRAFACASY